ncbi:MAG: hypothetical protein ACLVIR_13495 [Clostridium sp.]
MEAFLNQDWKGVYYLPRGGYQWLSPREGELVAKPLQPLDGSRILYYSVGLGGS